MHMAHDDIFTSTLKCYQHISRSHMAQSKPVGSRLRLVCTGRSSIQVHESHPTHGESGARVNLKSVPQMCKKYWEGINFLIENYRIIKSLSLEDTSKIKSNL